MPTKPTKTMIEKMSIRFDFPAPNRTLDTYFAEFRARARPTQPHARLGAEILYVTGGKLIINIDGEDQMPNEGDSIYFDLS
jgi:mannose-6-phosphate isomerase-like protein (cupin superfamily)